MTSRERWISKFQIKENSWVFVPTEETIQYGLEIKKIIEENWEPPKYFYHLASGGHVKALQQHLKYKYFLHLDIQNFFGNINRSRVTRCLKDFLPYDDARKMAIESTVRLPESDPKKYILPFGFVQSPILSSICLDKSALGTRMRTVSRKKDMGISIYMDDIILSSNSHTALSDQLEIFESASTRSKFPLNKTKQEGPGPEMTAFNIQLSHDLLEITEEKLKELLDKFELSENEHQRAGIYNYALSVNVNQADLAFSP